MNPSIELTALEVEQFQFNLDNAVFQYAAHSLAGELEPVLYDMFAYPERIQVERLRVVGAEPTAP